MKDEIFCRVDENTGWLVFGEPVSLFDLVTMIQKSLKGIHFFELMLFTGEKELIFMRSDYQVESESGGGALKQQDSKWQLSWATDNLPPRFECLLEQVRRAFPGQPFQGLQVLADRDQISVMPSW